MKDKLNQLIEWGYNPIPIIENTNNPNIQEMYLQYTDGDICIPNWNNLDIDKFINRVYRYC